MEAGAKDALKRIGEVLPGLGLSERTKLVTLSQPRGFPRILVSRIAAVARSFSSVEEQGWFSCEEPAQFFVIAGAHVFPVQPSTDTLVALRFMSAS